jgi:hypothetical protein
MCLIGIADAMTRGVPSNGDDGGNEFIDTWCDDNGNNDDVNDDDDNRQGVAREGRTGSTGRTAAARERQRLETY